MGRKKDEAMKKKIRNPCRECIHGWHCMDADRELPCNMYEGQEPRKGKTNEGCNSERDGSSAGNAAGAMETGDKHAAEELVPGRMAAGQTGTGSKGEGS